MLLCPCSSKLEFNACCGPYLAGKLAPTAVSLMRSRYTAHVMGNIDHIERTYAPEKRNENYRANVKQTIENTMWLGLEILNAKDGQADDQTGQVEYAYRYSRNGQTYLRQELGDFIRRDGAWLYKDSKVDPKSGTLPKPGRNEACPCGSGKKYKKCCGV